MWTLRIRRIVRAIRHRARRARPPARRQLHHARGRAICAARPTRRPISAPCRTGSSRRCCKRSPGVAGVDSHRRLCEGNIWSCPDVQRLAALQSDARRSRHRRSSASNRSTGAGHGRPQRRRPRRAVRCAHPAASRSSRHVVIATRDGVPDPARPGRRRAARARRIRMGSRLGEWPRGRHRHRDHAHRREQPHRLLGSRCAAEGDQRLAPARHRRSSRCSTAPSLVNATIPTVARNLAEGALLVDRRAVPAARQFPGGADRGAGDPDHHAADAASACCRRASPPI